MIIAIAGGHGQIALLLSELLSGQGHEPVALVRNADHLPDVQRHGARGEVIDLERATVEAVAAAIAGSDAVVFAAGAGPDSGPERKDSVDRGAAVLLADAAEQAGVSRYVMVSTMGADAADPESDDAFQVYLRAKSAAEDDLRSRRDLAWTIVRPGRLTDDAPTGSVELGSDVGRSQIPRADVAAVLAELVTTGAATGQTFEVVSGRMPVADAIGALQA